MKSRKPIEAAWQGYLKTVVPAGASSTQVSETRQAFFAGAALLFQALMCSMSEGEGIAEGDLQFMANLQTELLEFGQQLDKQAFGKTAH